MPAATLARVMRAFEAGEIDVLLCAVELRNRLGALSGSALPATVVFDYPTPEALAPRIRSTEIRTC